MTDFLTYPTFAAAETAAFAALRASPENSEGALAFVITAMDNSYGEVVFAPLFMIRHLDWIDRKRAEAARDYLLRKKHRVVFGGEVFGPHDRFRLQGAA